MISARHRLPPVDVNKCTLPDLLTPELVAVGSNRLNKYYGRSAQNILRSVFPTPKIHLLNLTQQRHISFFRKKNDGLDDIEEVANGSPENPMAQAAYYRALMEDGEPDMVIRRFDDGRYAKDKECVIHYMCALYETSQLERAVKYFLESGKPGKDNMTGSVDAINAMDTKWPSFLLGTKDRPIYVRSETKGGGFKKIGTLLNIVVVGAILYSLVAVNEQRLGTMGAKVHRMFSKDSVEKSYTFDDVQGCDEAKQELLDIVEFLKNPAKFNKLGARMPKGVLLVGPPGNGKTLLAKAVAGEADVPFYYASGSSFDEVFVGVGSMRIRQLFESAKQHAPSIVFIDELDAIGSKRNPRDPQHSRMSLNQLLTELDGFDEATGVIVIAATNIPEALDKALLRPGRFDKHVYVPLPDMRGRKAILEMYLRDVKLDLSVDVGLMARSTPGFSGADLFKLVNQAKIAASVENGNMVTMEQLETSKDEMILGKERKSTLLTPEDKKLTAYHEGGHAILAINTPRKTH